MSDLVEVAFKGNRKEFYRWDDVVPPPAPRTHVIVEGDRGEDLGQVHATGASAEARYAGVAHGIVLGEATRRVVRLATPDDVRKAQALTEENETTRRATMAQVRALGLQMKVTDAEWQWDHRKLTLFFTAERRVDFRTLVRDLAATFKARIELKQIGVRDEAKRLDGIGRCGRQYCSASWLPDLRPVNLGVAKEQKLSLNPTQISGACGRLMCCLRYEHDFYVQSRKRFPKEGKIITTLKGEEKVLLNDIFHDRVTLRGSDGETRIVTLLELRRETSAWTPGGTEEYSVADARDAAEEGELPFDDAPTLTMRTRVPPSARTLPVLPAKPAVTSATPAASRPVAEPATATLPVPALTPAPAPAPPVMITAAVVPPEPATPLDDDDTDGDGDDDEGADEGEDEGEDGVGLDAEASGEGPKRRRRRGRRGGRRGRGTRPGPAGDEPAAQ